MYRIVSYCRHAALAAAVIGLTPPGASAVNAWNESRQMVVITSSDWAATTGQMQRYVKTGSATAWKAEGAAIAVALGKTGMAWGRGLHPAIVDAPQKREGDGKTPAGVFRLTTGFGYADANDNVVKRLKLPYTTATATIECVDDERSAYYNRIVDRNSTQKPDWSSSEQMRRNDELYRWGVIVDHNAERTPGAGSCVFIHGWRAANRPTVGCAAMPVDMVRDLLAWLDPSLKPVIVHLPQAEYAKRKTSWELP
jgi:L,D-peptidoglycan transpeptidase YkuD (ErfK/YbiS/YcfS/YnhG family)